MSELRSAVYAADKSGNNVEGALRQLQVYVTSHMNTDLASGSTAVYPPIQLKYTYNRLVQAQAAQLEESNSQLYTQAQTYCQQLDPTDFSGHNRVPCIEQYVTSHSSVKLPQIPASLYEFSFVSPKWSPDLAGWSLLVTIVFALLTLVSLMSHWWFKRYVS